MREISKPTNIPYFNQFSLIYFSLLQKKSELDSLRPLMNFSYRISALCMLAGVGVYPAGWDSPLVRQTCGARAGRYDPGECSVRWAALLGAIGCLDAAILATLAFILAARHVRLQAEPGYAPSGSLYKGMRNSNPPYKSMKNFKLVFLIRES